MAQFIWSIFLGLPIGACALWWRDRSTSRTYLVACCALGLWGGLKLIGVPAWLDWPVWTVGVTLCFVVTARSLISLRRHKRAWRSGQQERIEAYLELLSKLEIAAYLQPAVRDDPLWQESRRLCRELLSLNEVNVDTLTIELDETTLTGVTMRPPSPN